MTNPGGVQSPTIAAQPTPPDEIDLSRKRLSHDSLSNNFGQSGGRWEYILIFLMLTGLWVGGLALTMYGLGKVESSGGWYGLMPVQETTRSGGTTSSREVMIPAAVVPAFGVAVMLVAFYATMRWVRSLASLLEYRKRLRRFPNEPWRSDYPWNPKGIASSDGMNGLSILAGGGIWTAFLCPFMLIAFREIGIFTLVIGIMLLAGLAILGYGCYLIARRIKYGRSFLAFGEFPFAAGGRVSVTLRNRDGIRMMNEMVLTLRFVEEVWEQSGKNGRMVCYQVYGATRHLDIHKWDGKPIDVVFDLAPEYATSMSVRPPKYWELEAKAATPGVDYGARFLLPVYRLPGTA